MVAATMLLWLSLNVYHEARGEPENIQIAVAQVTINRAKDRNQTIKETVKEPYQFSWTVTKKREKPWKDDPEVFLKCSLNAIRALTRPDKTGKATHYHEKRIKPRWAKKMKKIKVIGPFVLLKEKK